MVTYFTYKFLFSDLNDITRPPFSPGKCELMYFFKIQSRIKKSNVRVNGNYKNYVTLRIQDTTLYQS